MLGLLFLLSILIIIVGTIIYIKLIKPFLIKKKFENLVISNNIAYFHKSINQESYEEFNDRIKKLDKNRDLNLILHTDGGDSNYTSAITDTLWDIWQDKITVYIPKFAYSGGGFIALLCKKIILTPFSTLGPIDTQYTFDLDEIKNSFTFPVMTTNYIKSNKDNEDDNMMFNHVKRSLELCKKDDIYEFQKLSSRNKWDNKLKRRIFNFFASGRFPHEKIFTAKMVKDLGLNVDIVEKMPEDINYIFQNLDLKD